MDVHSKKVAAYKPGKDPIRNLTLDFLASRTVRSVSAF
jgi:hypothetical protein